MNVQVAPLSDLRVGLADLAEETDQPVYARPAFIEFLARATGGAPSVVLAESGGRAVGALAYLTLDRPGAGRVVNSLPWYGSHGGCVLDPARPDANAIRRTLLAAFRDVIKGDDLISATTILSPAEEPHRSVYVEALAPDAVDGRIGQVTALPDDAGPDGAALMSVFGQKTRNLVRKSLKQGFEESVRDDDAAWATLHRLHAANMTAMGAEPKPTAHFDALRAALAPQMRRLSLAMDGDEPVAALLLLHGGSTVEYLTPASDVRARARQPLSFLIWRGMLDAIARGARAWNWGGTWASQRSLHHFKAGFGAQDMPYSYLVTAPPSGVALLRARRRELGALFPYFYTYPYAALDDPS